ncbi:MAG: hypothetical protein HQK65_03335, partial [Desulfamplus sp.]|nr:hypothetical protein [Desulfamplus sp.]
VDIILNTDAVYSESEKTATHNEQAKEQNPYHKILIENAKKSIQDKEYGLAKEYLLDIPESSSYYAESKQLIESITRQ